MADTPKAEFAARLRDSRQVWRDLVAEVGDRVDDAGPMGDWTFGDLAGHLLAWRNRTIARLEAAGHGEPEPPPPWPTNLENDDAINSWIHEQDRGRSAAEMIWRSASMRACAREPAMSWGQSRRSMSIEAFRRWKSGC